MERFRLFAASTRFARWEGLLRCLQWRPRGLRCCLVNWETWNFGEFIYEVP